jgi:integration host factor subunit beta
MTKAELVRQVAARLHCTQRQTDRIVALVLQCIIDALRAGDKVELRGFGSFRVRARRPRIARNPHTGVRVQIRAKKVPVFTAGKALRALVNTPPAARARGPRR